MANLITLGIYNKNYKYIIFSIICGLFNNTLTEINYYTAFQPFILIHTEIQKQFSSHSLIHYIFCLFWYLYFCNIFF